MARIVNENTLFHLVPASQAAEDALRHPDNQRFVSLSAAYEPGLEIGFHVPPFSRGHVIARLGRNTDLILRESYSAVHVAFEIHPETFVVMLSVRTKRIDSVEVTVRGRDEENNSQQVISGDCAIIYGQNYRIRIAAYEFDLVWRNTGHGDGPESLRRLAIEGYNDSLERLKLVRSRDLSIPESSTPNSWYMTRLQSSKAPLVTELEGTRRLIGEGAFGKVFRAVDRGSGNYFAVKSVDLRNQGIDVELARAALHKEIKILERVSHANIIECLGTSDFHTDEPLIFMPLRPGSLDSLVKAKGASDDLCGQVLMQMLSALDYLAFRNLCHRDVKPPNILYQILDGDRYIFQLGDFGLANDCRLATTFCGTGYYQAPEFFSDGPQTPKVDVWSLFASIADIHPAFSYPPKRATNYNDVRRALQAVAATPAAAKLAPMARIDPNHRASAAQMLVILFDGQGLTTPRANIPPIEPEGSVPSPTRPLEAAPRPAPARLVQYPRRRQPQPSRPAAQPGMLPNRLVPPQQQPPPPYRVHRDGIAKRPVGPPQQRRLYEMSPQEGQFANQEKRLLQQREELASHHALSSSQRALRESTTPLLPGMFPA